MISLCVRLLAIPLAIVICGPPSLGQVVHLESPEYPDLARRARVQGTVKVRAHFDSTGAVIFTEVIDGNPALTEEAKHNLSRWSFAPGKPNVVEVVYEFRLRDQDVKYTPPCTSTSFDLPNRVLVISNAEQLNIDNVIVRPKKSKP